MEAAGMDAAVGIARDALEVARSHRRLAQHVMMAADHDLVACGLHLLLPPGERLAGDGAGRRAPAGDPAADRVGQVVAVAHHQEADVADLERVALPGALDRVGTLRRIDARGSVLSPMGSTHLRNHQLVGLPALDGASCGEASWLPAS